MALTGRVFNGNRIQPQRARSPEQRPRVLTALPITARPNGMTYTDPDKLSFEQAARELDRIVNGPKPVTREPGRRHCCFRARRGIELHCEKE